MNEIKVTEYGDIRVLTTQQLADAYETDSKVISNNYNRNKERHEEGKHFICLEGNEKREFLNHHQFEDGLKNASVIYLWTEKGTFLHAKSLNTDKAWEIYDRLVDTYFKLREEATHAQIPHGKELLALAVLEAQKTIEHQSAEIERMKPKEIFADAVSASHTSILIGDLAKLLKQNGVDTGQKRLFERLRDEGFLMKEGSSKNMPTQRAMEMGLFEVKEGSYIDSNGCNITTKTTKVTGKGQQYFINRFLGWNVISA